MGLEETLKWGPITGTNPNPTEFEKDKRMPDYFKRYIMNQAFRLCVLLGREQKKC